MKILSFITGTLLYIFITLKITEEVFTFINPYVGLLFLLAAVVFYLYIVYKLYKKHSK